jgi:aminoglycoside phosphotransferase (APT) family kinase protein
MELQIVNRILVLYNQVPVKCFAKSHAGFTNTVYELEDKLILKICTDAEENDVPFLLEAQLYGYFQSKLPVPQLIAYSDEKTIIPYSFMLYPRLPGENVYNVWHLMTVKQRTDIVKQLCVMLKLINDTNLIDLPSEIALKPVKNNCWREEITSRIYKYLEIVKSMQSLSSETIDRVERFVEDNSHCLNDQKLALTYWDIHFDNVLVNKTNGQITGLLDFERTDIASVDFVLETVKRMVDFPKKYMSEYAEQFFTKNEDYAELLNWYQEFYPELFAFKDMEKRLALYSLAHDLEDLENWPQVQQLKDNIERILNS